LDFTDPGYWGGKNQIKNVQKRKIQEVGGGEEDPIHIGDSDSAEESGEQSEEDNSRYIIGKVGIR
jgi:hypothetical protein